MSWIDVAADAEFPAGSQKTVRVGVNRVLVCRTETGSLHAVADLCPHALQPLSGGKIVGGRFRCARHGAMFDLGSGQPVNAVTDRCLSLYPLRVNEGRIEVGPRS